ncbi:MAG TPA: hypothetical protein VF912_06730 [Anaeromyxobacter sp.]
MVVVVVVVMNVDLDLDFDLDFDFDLDRSGFASLRSNEPLPPAGDPASRSGRETGQHFSLAPAKRGRGPGLTIPHI